MQNAWKEAARHWHEKMREAEKSLEIVRNARDEYRETRAAQHVEFTNKVAKLERRIAAERRSRRGLRAGQRAERDACFEVRRELEQKSMTLAVVREQLDSDFAAACDRERKLHEEVEKWRGLYRSERDDGIAERRELLQKLEELRAQPSGNPGEFADLAERIAEADEKHPRDLGDVESLQLAHNKAEMDYARRVLTTHPTWENALRCELAEAIDALVCGQTECFADELLDVATVALRWRRAVMERGKS